MSEIIDGELIDVVHPLVVDNIKNVKWKTKTGDIIPIPGLADSHLRNIALFLMDMGYTECVASHERRVLWLTVLSIEWKRRMILYKQDGKTTSLVETLKRSL